MAGALAGAAAASLAGCGGLLSQPTRSAMEVVFEPLARGPHPAPVLVVLLPGVNMDPAEMQREGMARAVRERGLAADVWLAHAHMGYVYDGTMLKRLQQDVLQPARELGYRQVWLAGISLGGYLALQTARETPGAVAGVVAIAPYLGQRGLLQAIADAGGVQRWRALPEDRTVPPGGPAAADARLWRWLAQLPPEAPPLHLAYGEQDRFAQAHATWADLLPPDRVLRAPGGHVWEPWRVLWQRWLDQAPWPRLAAVSRPSPAAPGR